MRGTRDLLSAEGSRTVTSELLAGKGAIEIQIVFGIGRGVFYTGFLGNSQIGAGIGTF